LLAWAPQGDRALPPEAIAAMVRSPYKTILTDA